MSQTERYYTIDQLLNDRKVVFFQPLMDQGSIQATLKRDLYTPRDRLNAQIIHDRDARAYRFDDSAPRLAGQCELPRSWLSAQEIHALLTRQPLLVSPGAGGMLGLRIRPLLSRLTALWGTADNSPEEIVKRVHIQNTCAREFHFENFQAAGSAPLRRKGLMIDCYAKGKDEHSRRETSPQRLVHYRNNRCLDPGAIFVAAWGGADDSIRRAAILEQRAEDVSEKMLKQEAGAGYGIFSGKDIKWAKLHFSLERSRWVACERWQPEQKGRFLDDGGYEPSVPYGSDPESLNAILKHGADCRAIAPDELKTRVSNEIVRMDTACAAP